MSKGNQKNIVRNISIVIPAKDEEETIGAVLSDVNKEIEKLSQYQWEVIVVVDHCCDNTEAIAQKCGAKTINNTMPPGKGNALITGFGAADGDIFIMMDADYSHRAEDIQKFITPFSDDAVGLVIGSRSLGGSEEYTFIRTMGNIGLTSCVNVFFSLKLTDSLNGYKAFRKNIFRNHMYSAKAFEIEIELIANTIAERKKIVEVPSHERARAGGEMKSRALRHGFRFLGCIIKKGVLYRTGLINCNMRIIKNKYDKQYFENAAYRSVANSQRNRMRLKEILSYQKEGRLLEIGCAKGELLDVAKKYFDVEGRDVSEYAVGCAQHVFGNAIKKVDICQEKLRENRYAVICAFNILEHIENPENTIKNVAQALTEKGIFIGSVPYNERLVGKLFTQFTNVIDKTHCSTYPPQVWQDIFEKAGFIKITCFGEVPLSRNYSMYLKHKLLKFFWCNLVFICHKNMTNI